MLSGRIFPLSVVEEETSLATKAQLATVRHVIIPSITLIDMKKRTLERVICKRLFIYPLKMAMAFTEPIQRSTP